MHCIPRAMFFPGGVSKRRGKHRKRRKKGKERKEGRKDKDMDIPSYDTHCLNVRFYI